MRRGASRIPGCLLVVSLALILCLIGTALAVIVLDRPGGVGSLPSTLQRTAYGLYVLLRTQDLDRPAGNPLAMAEITVHAGETADAVVQRMATVGIVHNPLLLRAFLRVEGLDTEIQAGRYALTGQMTPRQIAEVLQLGLSSQTRLTVVEGWRLEQIAGALAEAKAGPTAEAFLNAARNSRALHDGLGLSMPTAEGFLFPDTYAIADSTAAEDLVQTMLERFDEQIDAEMRQAYQAHGLSLAQATTLASIVEREAVLGEERPMIAAVFLNRLATGMRLEADPTVQYALGQQADGAWWKRSLTFEDLQVQSPYNTYQVDGLPPGPIANPGLASLRAVAYPADTQALFFRAACDGSGRHLFANTFEEHLENACP
jgi:UPF0755 protein